MCLKSVKVFDRLIRALVLAVVFLGLGQLSTSRAYAEEPDPKEQQALALLQGVENARLAIPSGLMEISTKYHSVNFENDGTVMVWFDGNLRRFDVLSGPTKGAKTIYNEPDLIHFDGDKSCTLRDPKKSAGEYCFDPRIIGISLGYRHQETVAEQLPYGNAKSVKLVGKEVLQLGKNDSSGKTTWHVQLVDTYDQQLDYWIEDTEGYPVHKYQFQLLDGTRRTVTISRYDRTKMPASIPIEFESTTYGDQDQIVNQVSMRVERASFGQRFDPQKFELPALQLPIGVPVTDLRLKKRVGYWDGSGLSTKALTPKVSTSQASQKTRGGTAYVIAGLVLTVVASVAIWWWRRKPQATSYHA